MAFKDLSIEQQAEIRRHINLSMEEKVAVWGRHALAYAEEQLAYWLAVGDFTQARKAAATVERRRAELTEYEAYLQARETAAQAA